MASAITVYRAVSPEAAVIVCMPAMGIEARFYSQLTENWLAAGWNVVTADPYGSARGHC